MLSATVCEFTVKKRGVLNLATLLLQIIGTKVQLSRGWHNQDVTNLRDRATKIHRRIKCYSLFFLLDYRI